MIYTDFVIRISLSMLLGFLIGLERQLTGHPAGIRINVLICMGTSFFTLFPMLYGSDQVFRVGSSIISGVGFLCSGVIFKDSGTVRGNEHGGDPLVYRCHRDSCQHWNVCNRHYRHRCTDRFQSASAPSCKKAESPYCGR